jgi:hypothetical protein
MNMKSMMRLSVDETVCNDKKVVNHSPVKVFDEYLFTVAYTDDLQVLAFEDMKISIEKKSTDAFADAKDQNKMRNKLISTIADNSEEVDRNDIQIIFRSCERKVDLESLYSESIESL